MLPVHMCRTVASFVSVACVGLCAAACVSQPDKSDATVQSFTLNLEGCPSPVDVRLPVEFRRAGSKQDVASKQACQYDKYLKAGSYECLFEDWAPAVRLPRVEVRTWTNFAPRYVPGQLDRGTWNAIRSSLGGSRSAAADRRTADWIRSMDAGAPDDESKIKAEYREFFLDSPDTARTLAAQSSIKESLVEGGRFFYVHGCIVSIVFFVSRGSGHPMKSLNNYMSRASVK